MTGLLFVIAAAAFEPQSDSPWLSGGAAAALFPRSHLAISVNPASIGLLDGTSLAISASRPFGFRMLDRTAAAGGTILSNMALAGYASYSGAEGYSEATLTGAGAFTLRRGIVGGVSVSAHRLTIQGFGEGSAFSTDIGLVARPVTGFYMGASVRGLYSTAPCTDGRPAVPRTVYGALGVCLLEGVTVSGAASIHQYSGEEFTVQSSIEAYPGVVVAAAVNTPPARLGFGIQVSLSKASLQYGYTTHPDLQSGHSLSLGYGSPGYSPEPIRFSESNDTCEQAVFPLNVNTASEAELQEIPGIGPSKASMIRDYIQENGYFETLDELIDIPGIGPATLERLRNYLTV